MISILKTTFFVSRYLFTSSEDATENFDAEFDARKLFPANEDIPQLFSTDLKDSPNMAINSVPVPNEKTNLYLGLKANEGNYTIYADELTVDAKEVILYDSYIKGYTNLTETGSYTFAHKGGTVTDRFELLFSSGAVSNIENLKNAEIKIYPNPASEFINVQLSDNMSNAKLKIYNISGVLVKDIELNDNSDKININELAKGMYIVEIKSNNSTKTQRITVE